VPCTRLLARDAGPAQTGRSLADRQRGPAFSLHRAAGVRAELLARAPVMVVDDVTTTGSTLSAAAAALRAAGVRWVGALTAARTPSRTPSRTPTRTVGSRSVSGSPPGVEISAQVRG
jgi:predicted amidophosphoribosyltransferase